MDAAFLEQHGVSAREAEVFWALRERPTNAELAEQLFISLRTVESHISSLLRKLGVADRLQLSDLARARTAPPTEHVLPAALGVLADASSFVGRGSQLTQLAEAWDRCSTEGQPSVQLVLGEAGLGKSRLVAEFASQVRGSGRILHGGCFAEVIEPFHPVAGIVAGQLDARRRSGELSSSLARVEATVRRIVGPVSDGSEVGPLGVGHGTAELVADAIVALVQEPTVLILEDLHWAPASTRDVPPSPGPGQPRCAARRRRHEPGHRARPRRSLGTLPRRPQRSQPDAGRGARGPVDRGGR